MIQATPISNVRIAERSGRFNYMEEDMSLSKKDKDALRKAIMRLAEIISNLENTAVDPRVLDMIEICCSLLEQQIEMDIVFETCNEDAHSDSYADLNTEAVHIKFEQNNPDEDIPSKETLQDWYNLGE